MILPIRKNFVNTLSPRGQRYSNAQDMGFFRNVTYLEKFIDRHYRSRTDSEKASAKRYLADFVEVAYDVFGANWDIYPQIISNISETWELTAILYYPEIQITNSDDLTHDIRDLIVKLPLRFLMGSDSYGIKDVRGGRIKQYAFEDSLGYHHSHLSLSRMPRNFDEILDYSVFGGFCTNGNEMQIYIDELSTQSTVEKDEIELFFHTLDSFLKWESLEGVPYYKIRELRRESGHGTNVTTSSPRNDNLLNFLEENPSRFELVYAQGQYRVVKDDSFKKTCKDYLLENHNYGQLCMREGANLISLPDDYNNVQAISQDLVPKNQNGTPFHLKIQGMQYNFSILRNTFGLDQEDTIDIEKYFVHPKLIDYVSKRIESQLYAKNAQREFVRAKIEGNYV